MSFELQELGRLNSRLNALEDVLGQTPAFAETKKKLDAKKAEIEASTKPIELTAEERQAIIKAREANKPLELSPEEREAILARRGAEPVAA